MSDNCYEFPAIRGIQAKREYYVAMCELKVVARLFVFNDAEVPAELRAQRVLNKARIPEIAQYLVTNAENYVLSSITACIDGEVSFEPFATHGKQRNAGLLQINMGSRVLVNDGQHRHAAIVSALKEKPQLANETISVVFFIDAGLERSQQWFADLNKHAVRPTRSIGILFDHRDVLSNVARKLERRVPIFCGFTELEKTTISNRSTRLFTLSAIYQASAALLMKQRRDEIDEDDVDRASSFWTALGEVISEWDAVIHHHLSPAELRQTYINGHGVTLQALGIAGASLFASHPNDWQDRLRSIAKIDWQRSNPLWDGRALIRGKLSKSRDSVLLTANVIKDALGLELSPEEQQLENEIHKSGRDV